MDLLNDVFDYCPELIFIAEPDSAIVRLSASLARLLGPEVQRGTRLVDRVHPDDREGFDIGWARTNQGEQPGEAAAPFMFRLLDADGAYRPVSCNARKSPRSGERHGSLREASAEPNIAELERSAELLRAIENSVPMSIWAIDRKGIFIHHAGKGVEAAGFKPGQFLGLNIYDLYAGGAGVPMLGEALAGQIGHTISKQHNTYWETWYVPLRDRSSEIVGVAGLTLDISAVTRAEQELRDKLDLIERQQQVIRALSTPIIEVWDKVLTLPMLGVVDSTRAAEIMESTLNRVRRDRSQFAILDLTGVDTIDTHTAAHLLKMIQALRLLGAEGIIVGIQPSVAQTMVTLGIDLQSIVTRANLQAGLRYCIQRMRDGAA